MKTLFRTAFAGASLIAISAPGIVLAQTTDDAAAATEEEGADESIIVVNARRRDESLQEVPVSVQAVSGDQLQKLEIKNFIDIAATVPGLSLTRASNGIQNTVALRGVSFNPTAAGPQTAVELYRNDVVTSSAAIFQAMYDIQQIEVLRGPQGTLRGRASPSGSLTITTKKPDLQEYGGFVSGSLAEGNEWNATGAANLPIFKDRLGIRVAGFTSKDRGNDVGRVNLFTKTIDNDVSDRIESFRGSVRAVPFVDVLTLDFNYEDTKRKVRSFEQYESRGFVEGSTLNGPVTISSKDYLGIQILPNTLDGRYKFYNWQAALDLGAHTMTYVGGQLDAVSNALAPEDFGGILSNQFAPPAAANPAPAGTLNPFSQITSSEQHQKFTEIRLQSDEPVGGVFDYVVGYMKLKSDTPTLLYTTGTSCVGGAANCVAGGLASQTYAGVYRTRTDLENSVFGNLTVHIGEKTEISGGARSINFKRDSGLISAGRNGVGQILFDKEPFSVLSARAPVASFVVKDSINATIYTLAARHKLSDDLMVYANYGTSFRPGNVIVCSRCTAAQNTTLIAGGYLKPANESSKSIEAGFKSTFMDRRATFNLSVFSQKFDNFTVISPVAIQFLGSYTAGTPATGALASGTNSLALANDVKVTGFEAEFGFRPSDNFSIGGNFAYAKSKATNGRVPCIDLNNDNVQDAAPVTAANLQQLIDQAGPGLVDTCAISRVGSAPDFSATINGEFNAPVGSFGEGYLRGLLTYNGKTVGDDVNAVDSVSAYALVNLYAGIRDADGMWDLSVYGKNVTGTHKVLSRNGTRATSTIANVAYPSDYYQIGTTAPREFGINLRIALGSR